MHSERGRRATSQTLPGTQLAWHLHVHLALGHLLFRKTQLGDENTIGQSKDAMIPVGILNTNFKTVGPSGCGAPDSSCEVFFLLQAQERPLRMPLKRVWWERLRL